MKRLLALLLLCSCSREPLSVYTEYVSIESLPSYHIGTPDPRLYCPDFGEKLHISWAVAEEAPYCSLSLKIDLRYGNGQFASETIDLDTHEGIFVIPLLNEEYRSLEGIFTYQITLYGDDCPLATRTHLLWKEPIILEIED